MALSVSASNRARVDDAGPADARDHASEVRACVDADEAPVLRHLNARADDARHGRVDARARQARACERANGAL